MAEEDQAAIVAGAADGAAIEAVDARAQGGVAIDAGLDSGAVEAAAGDWRARLAGGDEKLLGYLGRYQSERAFVEAAKKDREALRARQAHRLADNPTGEELAEYRRQHGVPDTPEGYLALLPDGLVVGDDDRPYVDRFLAEMHALHAPPALTGAALDAYYAIVEDQAAARSEMEAEARAESTEILRAEWGADYKRNLNAMHAHLDTLPEPVAEAFRFGRHADGVPLGYDAEVLKWLAGLALEANPLSTVVPGGGAGRASAVADEIAAIEGVMRRDRAAYNGDEGMQARYRELLSARERLG